MRVLECVYLCAFLMRIRGHVQVQCLEYLCAGMLSNVKFMCSPVFVCVCLCLCILCVCMCAGVFPHSVIDSSH